MMTTPFVAEITGLDFHNDGRMTYTHSDRDTLWSLARTTERYGMRGLLTAITFALADDGRWAMTLTFERP